MNAYLKEVLWIRIRMWIRTGIKTLDPDSLKMLDPEIGSTALSETLFFYTFADAHHIEQEIPLILVLIADAAQLRMRLQRAPVDRVGKTGFFKKPAQWFFYIFARRERSF